MGVGCDFLNSANPDLSEHEVEAEKDVVAEIVIEIVDWGRVVFLPPFGMWRMFIRDCYIIRYIVQRQLSY